MAGKPQVTLTFAGDSTKLESAFSKVGESARGMEGEVGKASKKVGESADSFDKAGEAADSMDTKAMGFRDTMTGVQDTMGGVSEIAKGNLFEGFLTLGTGISDLGSGLYNFLIPSLKSLSKEMIGNAVQTVRSTATNAAHKVGMLASTVATNAMTVAQKGLNLAMRMNPIGLIITAIMLLVGAVIIAYKNSETFRRIVDGAFRAVQKAAAFAFNWVKDNWKLLLGIVTGPIGLAVTAIGKHKDTILGFFQSIPGKIGGFFSGLANTIKAPFQSAFQGIKNAWNNTVGGKGFSIPGWVPNLGGKDFRIPYFHTGGVMPGAPGTEGLAMLQAGERIIPVGARPTPEPAGDTIVYITIDGEQLQGRIDRTVRADRRSLKRAVGAGAF